MGRTLNQDSFIVAFPNLCFRAIIIFMILYCTRRCDYDHGIDAMSAVDSQLYGVIAVFPLNNRNFALMFLYIKTLRMPSNTI